MAVPAIASRSVPRASVLSEVASAEQRHVRRFAPGRGYFLILAALTFAALLSRVYTTNSLAGEPTSDEYLYGVHARDLARGWMAGQPVSLDDLGVEGRSIVVESAALSLVLPWDPITLGRTMQALFNALCVPLTFVVGRQIGLTRSAALVGALLLMAVPEFQELAWRFWTDSQATFVSLVYLGALIAFMRRPSVVSGVISLASLALLLLTKESAAVTFAPFLLLTLAVVVSRRLTVGGRRYAIAAVGILALATAALAFVASRGPGDLTRNTLLEKTFGAGPLVLSSIRDAIPMLPSYSQQLVSLIGPVELGTGFLWACLVGAFWLLAQSAVAVFTHRPRLNFWVAGWIVAAVVWLPAMAIPWRDIVSLRQTEPWVLVAAGALLVVVGTAELHLRNSGRTGWGIALLGLVVLSVLAERLIISVTPKVSAAALTFRVLMPIVPLFGLVAGGGLWAAAGAPALLMPNVRWARSLFALLAAGVLLLFWSPLLHERLSNRPLLGRIADRGADPDTPQGLRVQVLVDAQPWLQANLRSSDVTIVGAGLLRHLAWYADLGVDGMNNLIDLGAQPRTPEQKRQYILDRIGPRGVGWIVDFNVDWMDPGGDKARQWRQTYDVLHNEPHLETAYVVNDRFGYPVFYAIRNRGFVIAPPT